MRIEWWILILVYVVATGLLFFIPKNKIRIAVVAFVFKQVITFLIGLVVVQLGLIEYPVRSFASINRTSFDYEFYFFPVTCAVFNAWYPTHRRALIQLGYYLLFSTVLTVGEVIIERYTDLIHYIHWKWYISFLTIFISFYIVRTFCVWFFSKPDKG
jgi:hypothetical protein